MLTLQDSTVDAGGVVSNDERNVRRWRLGQLGYIAETSLWMLVVNALAHEGGGGTPVPPAEERRKLHDELTELFETRLDEHAALWESLVSAASLGLGRNMVLLSLRVKSILEVNSTCMLYLTSF